MTSWAKGFFAPLVEKSETVLVTGILAGSSLAMREAQLALKGSKASMGESSSTPLAKLACPFPTLLLD